MKKLLTTLRFWGLDPILFFKNIKGIPFFFRDLQNIKKQCIFTGAKKEFPLKYYPVLTDKYTKAGTMSGHYFHQDLLVAKKIYTTNPAKHVDIGSRIDGFIAHVAVFREIEVFDVRELNGTIDNIRFKKANLMEIPANMHNYCDSISALHSIEHFGLGRYGDPVDYFGHVKAIKNIVQILKPSGIFYFSVPIGKQRIEFNAHRVFSVSYLWDLLKENFILISFSYVDDIGNLHENVEFTDASIKNSFKCDYGCGIFELKKNEI